MTSLNRQMSNERQSTTESELYYNGRPLSAEPLPTDGSPLRLNQSLSGLAMWLSLGHACTTTLEPGDGTRYELLLVPNQGLTKFDETGDDRRYVFVCYMVGGRSRGSDVLRMGNLRAHNLYALDPVPEEYWTKTFLAWWLNKLWRLIEERMMPLTTFVPEKNEMLRQEQSDHIRRVAKLAEVRHEPKRLHSGWRCSCGSDFSTEDDIMEHIVNA